MIKSNKIVILSISLIFIFLLSLIFLLKDISSIFVKNDYSLNLYQEKIFDISKVHNVNLIINNFVWSDYLKYLDSLDMYEKSYVSCDIEIDGEYITNVGIRPKGGGTYKQIFESENLNKYPFKIKFDEYIDNQSYYGLDSFELNNQIFDKTYMADYLAYDMMRHMGVPAPLTSYVNLYVNGEFFGFYLCVESMEESFLKRNYGDDYGMLYKPYYDPIVLENNKELPRGSDLVYRGNDEKYYSNILISSKTNKVLTSEDKNRLINAIRLLNEGDLANSIDIENTVKYFVVHNFVMNYDSYWSKSPHNYYLYEKDGLLTMLPWDYDFAFKGYFVRDKIKNNINTNDFIPIDNPLINETNYIIDDRPMWKYIIETPETRELYHKYFNNFIESYFESGYFEEQFDKTYNMIKSSVEKDYYKNNINEDVVFKDYATRVFYLKQFCILRANDVKNQLIDVLSITNYNEKNIILKDKVKNNVFDIMR